MKEKSRKGREKLLIERFSITDLMELATNMEVSYSITTFEMYTCSKEETDISYQFNVPWNVESTYKF